MRIVMKYAYRCLFLHSLVWSLSFSAAAESLDSLRAEHSRLEEVRDSLLTQRAVLTARLDTLANQIYGLKRADTGGVAETLQRVLRQTLELADRIERVDMAFEAMRTALAHLRQKLRAHYDREIDAAIAALEQGPDAAKADRLRALQRARGALEEGGMEIRPAEAQMLEVREDDGPDEIRQKADLMEDMAAQTRVKADVVVQRIKRLEEERILRVRMDTLRGEMDVFDEVVLEGSSRSPRRAFFVRTGGVLPDTAGQTAADVLPEVVVGAERPPIEPSRSDTTEREDPLLESGSAPEREIGLSHLPAPPAPPEALSADDLISEKDRRSFFPVSGSAPERAIVVEPEIGLSQAQTPPEVLSSDDLISEIARLKGIQKALSTREQALKRRAEAFRKHLQQMLEGN